MSTRVGPGRCRATRSPPPPRAGSAETEPTAEARPRSRRYSCATRRFVRTSVTDHPEPEADLDNLEADLPPDGEDRDQSDFGEIKQPFDPREIEVVTKGFTVDLLLKRLKSDELTLQPDFQRSAV